MTPVYRAQLCNRKRSMKEGIQEFAAEIDRLSRRAYEDLPQAAVDEVPHDSKATTSGQQPTHRRKHWKKARQLYDRYGGECFRYQTRLDIAVQSPADSQS
ncbi:hypothetical protein CBL_20671 [Carabus blaptoides fortunei]